MCACTCCKCVSCKTAYSPRCSSSISAAMQYSSESLKQQPELPYTHTGKLTNTHTTAVKCHANTFYRPPLTSLIRTLHFKVEAEKKEKETDLLTRFNSSQYNGGIVSRKIFYFCSFFFSFLIQRSLFFCGVLFVNSLFSSQGDNVVYSRAGLTASCYPSSGFVCTLFNYHLENNKLKWVLAATEGVFSCFLLYSAQNQEKNMTGCRKLTIRRQCSLFPPKSAGDKLVSR